jgi:pimeloyl-ACP methyl ester carboxylesterase
MGERAREADEAAAVAGAVMLLVGLLRATAPLQASAQAPDSGYVAFDGGRLFYRSAGRGQAIVFVGLGGGVDSRLWQRQFDGLKAGYRVVAYDARGFGKSDAPTRPYSHSADLIHVLRSIGVGRACLVGLSAGGGVAIDAVLRAPELFDCLVVAGTVLGGHRYSDAFARREAANAAPAARGDFAAVADNWISDPYQMPTADAAARRRYRGLRLDPANLRALRSAQPNLSTPLEPPATARLSEIHARMLILIGERDFPDMLTISRMLERGVRGARRVVLLRAGHLLPVECPESVTHEIEKFLRRRPDPDGERDRAFRCR